MHITDMTIGFTQREQTISEADRPFPQDQRFFLDVDVRSEGVSEIDYNVTIVNETRPMMASGVARVADIRADITGQDALFGIINAITGDLEDTRLLVNGSTALQTPLTVTIVNDMDPEPVECFELLITSPDAAVDRERYVCFDDDDSSLSFFCLHKICIGDDDGL